MPKPLGANAIDSRINFAVWAPDSDRVQICLLDESGVGYMVKIEATTTGSADQYPSATVTLSPLATCWLVLDS